ncbi:MAG: exosome complex exonuclease Rrp41 [Thermoplasmata archaeon]
MSGMKSDVKLIDESGKRIDGRLFNEMRPIKIEAGILERADGSAYIEWGNNKIIAAVFGPREIYPKHIQDPSKAVLRARYNMAAFSVDERKKPGPDRRSVELSLVISNALSSVVFLEQYPRTAIDVFIEVLQADAGTRIAGLTAASVALADAGIPMKDLIAGCAVGKVENTIVLDLNKDEDNYGQADMPVAIIPRTKEIVLFQMDGDMDYQEIKNGLNMALDASMKVYEIEKEALKNKYIKLAGGDSDE